MNHFNLRRSPVIHINIETHITYLLKINTSFTKTQIVDAFKNIRTVRSLLSN